MTTTKISKVATGIGSVFLAIMSLLHGSGIGYVNNLMQESNAEDFLKEIFPVLFAHPSIQLLGLAALGVLTLFMKHETEKVLLFITILIAVNCGLAFYLGATIPGILLLSSAFAFGLGGFVKMKSKSISS